MHVIVYDNLIEHFLPVYREIYHKRNPNTKSCRVLWESNTKVKTSIPPLVVRKEVSFSQPERNYRNRNGNMHHETIKVTKISSGLPFKAKDVPI